MKILWHDFQLSYRGSSLSTYNYAKYNQEILGNESVIVSTSSRPNEMELLEKCKSLCKVVLYPEVWNGNDNSHLRTALEKIVAEEKADVFYAQKGGENDGIMPGNCKTIAHYVFRGDQQHGDSYVAISEYLAKKHSRTDYIPYIVRNFDHRYNGGIRYNYCIPKEDLVIGWTGGSTSFSVDFVKNSILELLEKRKDLWFVFMPNSIGISHERIRSNPISVDPHEKKLFIGTCDAMIHARRDGETFGLACAEFSAANKPVITYDGFEPWYDRAHIDMLGEKCFKYKNKQELFDIILNLDRKDIAGKDWNAYRSFNPKTVMEKFKSYL